MRIRARDESGHVLLRGHKSGGLRRRHLGPVPHKGAVFFFDTRRITRAVPPTQKPREPAAVLCSIGCPPDRVAGMLYTGANGLSIRGSIIFIGQFSGIDPHMSTHYLKDYP